MPRWKSLRNSSILAVTPIPVLNNHHGNIVVVYVESISRTVPTRANKLIGFTCYIATNSAAYADLT